jgi:two-component system, OmpR family, response regulator ResD
MTPKVLVVDDEPIVREVLGRYLAKDGFEVELAEDGEGAIAVFASTQPDLVLLDLMLPKLDGFQVFERIRALSDTPVIMLTAKTAEHDRIAGLERGADDYVSKPFSPGEVVARVKAVLRRSPEWEPGDIDELVFGEIKIDVAGRRVYLNGEHVALTPKEFDLLFFMASHPGTVFTRLNLLEELWDFAFYGDPATVTVHIRRLREKIEQDPSNPGHLVTVWGTGYRFDP